MSIISEAAKLALKEAKVAMENPSLQDAGAKLLESTHNYETALKSATVARTSSEPHPAALSEGRLGGLSESRLGALSKPYTGGLPEPRLGALSKPYTGGLPEPRLTALHPHSTKTTTVDAPQIPSAEGFAGKHQPFEDTYMDWNEQSLEQRHGAIAHLDKAPDSVNDAVRHKIIQYALMDDRPNVKSEPSIRMIGASRIPSGKLVADQEHNFTWAMGMVGPSADAEFVSQPTDLHMLKILVGIVPDLHPQARGAAVRSFLGLHDMPAQLEQAFSKVDHHPGITQEVEALLAKTDERSGHHYYTDLVAGLDAKNRRAIWDQTMGFAQLRDEFKGMPQDERVQVWGQVKDAQPGELSTNQTTAALAQFWSRQLADGEPTVTKAFAGFPLKAQQPPDLVRKELPPAQFEPFGNAANAGVDAVSNGSNTAHWTDRMLWGGTDQRLPRSTLSGIASTDARKTIESISSDQSATPDRLATEIKGLFPEINLADNKSALKRLHANPTFQALAEADKADLNLALTLSDASLGSGLARPGQASNIAHGVMSSLELNPVRAQRIASLINGRAIGLAALRDQPSVTWGTDPVTDLATMMRTPHQAMRLQALLRAVHANPPESIALMRAVNNKAHELTTNAVPVLTNELPNRFTAFTLTGNFSLFSHVSTPDIGLEGAGVGDHFIRVLPKMESPNAPVSLSILSPDNRSVYFLNDKPSLAAIFSVAPENISSAGARDLWTHRYNNGSWARHVEDVNRHSQKELTGWSHDQLLPDVITGKRLSTDELRDAWNDVTKFHSYDQAAASSSKNLNTLDSISKSLTAHVRENSGVNSHSEAKAVDISLSGFLVQRRGSNVAFEGMDNLDQQALFNGSRPTWVRPSTRWEDQTLHVPTSIWTEAQKRGIPFVFLD